MQVKKLSAGTETEAKCFAGLFPSSIKTIALIAPSTPGDHPEAVDEGIRLLEEAGIKVKVMPNARLGEPGGRGTSIAAEKRVSDLEQAWLDPEVDLILCIRGGIGGAEIAEKIHWEKLRGRDMKLVGFSDVTTLHLAMLHEKAGHPLCGPSLRGLMTADQESLEVFHTVLSGKTPAPIQLQAIRPGRTAGMILPGNLQRFDIMNRTKFRPDTGGKVIFTEAVGMDEKQLTAAWKRLCKSGFFTNCAGVVFGRLTGCREEEETIRKLAGQVNCPVFSGFPYSHTPRNHMLDPRRKVRITESGTLIFE